MSYRLDFLDDPAAFLAAAGGWLAERPVESTVVASVTARMLREGLPAERPSPLWWLVVRDSGGTVVGAGMRTFPHPPYMAYLLAMPEDAARLVARTLHERGEEVAGINGALPAVATFADEYARLAGGSVRVAEHMRLHELDVLDPPPVPKGQLRVATADEVDLVLAWFDAFSADAAEQAGNPGPHPGPIETRESTLHRIAAGEVWLWETEPSAAGDGVAVHVTAFNQPCFGVARVGPVYTPKVHRGHGYAAFAVAEVSRKLLEDGSRVCLFTDQANSTSNALYERLGYRAVVDMANLVIEPAARQDGSRDPTTA